MTATLGGMTARVQRELGRGTDDQVRESVVSALKEARREAHLFSQRRDARIETETGRGWYSTIGFPSWTTATAEEVEAESGGRAEETEWSFDDLPHTGRIENLIRESFVKIRKGANEWPLCRSTYEAFATLSTNASTKSQPTTYTIHAQQIGLWPIPDGVYEVRISGVWKPYIPEPAYGDAKLDGATSAFFEHGEEFIRNGAKRRYCEAVRDMDGAMDFSTLESRALSRLRSENTHHNTDPIRPWGVH